MSERRSARDRKPKQSFSPDLYDLPKKTNKKRGQNSNSRNNNNGNGNGRGTNKSQDGQFNKWHEYLLRLRRHLAVLVKEQNYLELYQENYQFTATNISTSSAYSSSFGGKTNVVPLEVSKCQQRIVQAKQAILTVFEQISAENSTDTQWEQLQKQDEDGMVDVLDVLCSRCHGEDVEGNDILFCDRKGCHRAYHQGCLDPPIVVTEETLDPNLAWFCWQCECLDNCLDNCNERLETELMDWKELFPELKAGQKQSSGENEYGRSLDDDDEDDESFRSADATDSDEDEGSDRLQSEDEEKGDDMNAGDSKVSDKSDNDDSSCDSDSVESEAIDDEEVQLLMNETGLPSDYIDLTSTKMRLRKKPEVEEITVHEPKGRSDIGQLVAVVRRGVLLVGRVVAYQPSRSVPKKEASTILDNGGSTVATGESHELSQLEDIPTDSAVLKIEENENGNSKELTTFPSVVSAENTVVAPAGISNGLWTVILGSEMVEATLTYDEIRKAFWYYADFERSMQAENALKVEEVEKAEDAQVDVANIVAGKRQRRSVDYVSLSLEMFGTLHDEEDELGAKGYSPKKRKKEPQKKSHEEESSKPQQLTTE